MVPTIPPVLVPPTTGVSVKLAPGATTLLFAMIAKTRGELTIEGSANGVAQLESALANRTPFRTDR